MHPFQRLSHNVPSPKKCSSQRKDRGNFRTADRDEYDMQNEPTAFDTKERLDSGTLHQKSPAKKLSCETETKNPRNILKAKEKALWSNSSTEWDDNSERLGPNKNSIIVESLKPKK